MWTALLPLTTTLLAATPQDTTQYVVLNHGRAAGSMQVTVAGNSATIHFQYQDRQRGPRLTTQYRFDAAGGIATMETRGLSAAGMPLPVSERIDVTAGEMRWQGQVDSAHAPLDRAALFRLRNTTPYDDALLARLLLQQPQRSARLFPVGSARADIVADTVLTYHGAPLRLRLVVTEGIALSPVAVWLDEEGELFSSEATAWFITIRRGGEAVIPVLRSMETAYRMERSASLAQRLTTVGTGPIVIRNGDVFDSERGLVRPRTTIVIENGRITDVGRADSIRTPRGATIIDATGKTVLPGLWDMHTHLPGGIDEATRGLLQLAAGITTMRDLSSDIDVALSHRARARAGTLLSPRVLLAGFMDGPGLWVAPTDALVRTEAEAQKWIAVYDSLGYRQLKLYNLVHPDLVPTIAREAAARGLRLSGHIPRGLSIPAAVHLGFQEIHHAPFLFANLFQDSLYVPRMRAYSEVAAAVAATFDVDRPEMIGLISLLRESATVVDGTFNIMQTVAPLLPDGTHPVYGPTVTWLPPVVRHALPNPPRAPAQAAGLAAANANFSRLLKRLFEAGVTLVAGTDNVNLPGLSYHGELEIYERAGIPAVDVLQIATIIPARVMGEAANYGSIAVGKVADIVIVDGRPAENIRDLRRTEIILRAGRIHRARDLYRAAGLTPTH